MISTDFNQNAPQIPRFPHVLQTEHVSKTSLKKTPHQHIYTNIPVVPGQAGGGSFQKEKNYIAKKEFAYRMCARQRAFCRSMVVMSCALK